jgi:N-methylhydantoinase A
MQSNGGAISVATAGREAVRTLLSGPAGGVIGALAVARRLGIDRIISFDMGGTSTDVSLVDGDVRLQTDWSIADLPVKVPAIDIHTVGAGGGSLAFCDAGGALKVGPQSAGADPGPACYGRGTGATVTDANVVLGRLVADAFLGGRMRLDEARARTAVENLGRAFRRGPEQAAEGIVRVVNAGMERAIRRISVERGHDPREYTLVAFGGAAGLHACELAMGLGIERVLFPCQPGLLSALGAVSADLQRDYVQTVRLLDPTAADLTRRFRAMRTRARRDLRAEGASAAAIQIAASLDVRYRGQSYEVSVPMQSDYRRRFHEAHERLYGYSDPTRPLEVVNLRVAGSAPSQAPPSPPVSRNPARALPHRIHWAGRWVPAQLYPREALPSAGVQGAAVITEFSATLLVPEGWTVRVAETGDLILERQRQTRKSRRLEVKQRR